MAGWWVVGLPSWGGGRWRLQRSVGVCAATGPKRDVITAREKKWLDILLQLLWTTSRDARTLSQTGRSAGERGGGDRNKNLFLCVRCVYLLRLRLGSAARQPPPPPPPPPQQQQQQSKGREGTERLNRLGFAQRWDGNRFFRVRPFLRCVTAHSDLCCGGTRTRITQLFRSLSSSPIPLCDGRWKYHTPPLSQEACAREAAAPPFPSCEK